MAKTVDSGKKVCLTYCVVLVCRMKQAKSSFQRKVRVIFYLFRYIKRQVVLKNEDLYNFKTNSTLGSYCWSSKLLSFHISHTKNWVKYVKNSAVCAALEKGVWEHIQKQKQTCTVKDILVVFVLCLCCLCGSWSLGILGCGVSNCLEETWEERGYREKRKEGGRAQYGVGIFWKEFFLPRVTFGVGGRAVWICQSDYLSGMSSAHKYLFRVSFQGDVNHRLQGCGATPIRGQTLSQTAVYDSCWYESPWLAKFGLFFEVDSSKWDTSFEPEKRI